MNEEFRVHVYMRFTSMPNTNTNFKLYAPVCKNEILHQAHPSASHAWI